MVANFLLIMLNQILSGYQVEFKSYCKVLSSSKLSNQMELVTYGL